ncbi:MAG: F0F1 ATP synthase subunit B [Patescibacteria group bacterium]
MGLIEALGLDINILIAQLVNFAILVVVLWKFGYKPILKFLDERKNKIEKGVKDAEKAAGRLIEIADKEKDIITKAKKEALIILDQAKQQGEENGKKMIAKAKEEIGQIINQEKQKIQIEKAKTLKDIKTEIGDLVARTVAKVLDKKLDKKEDNELIKKILKK